MIAVTATTRTIEISSVRSEFDELVDRVYRGEGRVLVEKSGVPVAALVTPEDLECLDRIERERARVERFKILDEMQAAFAGVSEEEIERETAQALAEVHAEMRAEREQGSAPA